MHFLLASSAFAAIATSVQARVSKNPHTILPRRSDQADDDNLCHCYGIDYQNEGTYFIDSRSSDSFTCVSQFENSKGDPAYIVLIKDDDDDDQWECTSVPTTPDGTNQLSTCPITKDQMTTGNWTIITMGNNNNGTAFAWERNFYLSVGVPETFTSTPVVTYTQTSTPSTTVTATSTLTTTTTISNPLTITTAASTLSQTITPEPTTTTSTSYVTRTSNTWTKTLILVTTTQTPTCKIPSRPDIADPPASHTPTVVAIPVGVKIASPSSSNNKRRSARENQLAERKLALRTPDSPTLTITASEPVNTTTTIFALMTTFTDTSFITSTATITGEPLTLTQNATVMTFTAATPTKTDTEVAYTTEYATKTMAVTWTITSSVTTAAASVSACKLEGGHYDL